MSARDLINAACAKANAWRDRTYATAVLDELSAAGYAILSPDEVRGIRDEALEEAAKEAKSWEQTARKLSRKEPDKERSLYYSLAGDTARDVASAIRSLKGERP